MIPLIHLTLSAVGRSALCPTRAACLRHVRQVVASLGARLLLFCVVDDHIHCVVEGPRGLAGPQVSGLVRSLQARGFKLQEAHYKPVDGRRHLETLVRYLFEQPRKHGLPGHPALWPGSCFADLVGARCQEGFDLAALQVHLPRWRVDRVWAALDLQRLSPLEDGQVRRLGAWRIVDGAHRVFAVPDPRAHRQPPAQRARRAAVGLGVLVGVSRSELASALGITRRSVNRLATREVPAEHLHALRLRLALEERVGLPREGIAAPPSPVPA